MTNHTPESTTGAPAAPAASGQSAAPAKTTNGWGIAGLVLGIISFLLGCIPFFGFLAFVPAPFGVIASIVGMTRKGQKRGMAIAGLVLSILAIIVGSLLSFGLMMALSGVGFAEFFTVTPGTVEVQSS